MQVCKADRETPKILVAAITAKVSSIKMFTYRAENKCTTHFPDFLNFYITVMCYFVLYINVMKLSSLKGYEYFCTSHTRCGFAVEF